MCLPVFFIDLRSLSGCRSLKQQLFSYCSHLMLLPTIFGESSSEALLYCELRVGRGRQAMRERKGKRRWLLLSVLH
jgi:hypothetical protein